MESNLSATQRAKSKYSKTDKGKACVKKYYERTRDERLLKQKMWRDKQKARLEFLESFYEKHKHLDCV